MLLGDIDALSSNYLHFLFKAELKLSVFPIYSIDLDHIVPVHIILMSLGLQVFF